MKLTSCLVITVLAFSSVAFAQKPSDVVATVGSKKITLEEFNKKYKEVLSVALVNAPTKEQFLEDLVRYELGLQEAKRRGLEKDPMVQERVNQELYKVLLEKELGQKVQDTKVSDAEMKAWYAKNPSIRTSHILIEFKAGATAEQKAEARKRANEILEEVRKSKRPFEELVRIYTDDQLSKVTGGDVGWQSRMNIVPTYYDATLGMKVGEIKGPVETPFGFHIVKLTGRQSYEEADHKAIRAAVFDEKRKQTFDGFFNKLKSSNSVKMNTNLLR